MQLPEGWQRGALGSYIDLITGYPFPSQDYAKGNELTIRLLRGDNIMQGALRWEDAKHWQMPYGEQLVRYAMLEGDIVIAMDRPIVNAGLKCATIKPEDLPSLLVQRVARLRAKENIDQRYLGYLLQTHHFTQHLKGKKTETAVPHISPNDIRNFVITLPSKREQRRIASILSTWDQAIATAERLLANSRQQKQALMQILLTDKYRLLNNRPVLNREHASNIFMPTSIRRNGALDLLSVMQDIGVVPRSSLDRKVVNPEGSTEGYKLVEPGDFVISLRSFEGGLEYSRHTGLVSPAYTVLKPKRPIVDDFYRHYFKSTDFIGRLAVAVVGIRDGKQISYDDFSFLRLPHPELAEQQSIAEVLNNAESLIHRHVAQLDHFRCEKAALLSQLLTGKRRVHLPESEVKAAA